MSLAFQAVNKTDHTWREFCAWGTRSHCENAWVAHSGRPFLRANKALRILKNHHSCAVYIAYFYGEK